MTRIQHIRKVFTEATDHQDIYRGLVLLTRYLKKDKKAVAFTPLFKLYQESYNRVNGQS